MLNFLKNFFLFTFFFLFKQNLRENSGFFIFLVGFGKLLIKRNKERDKFSVNLLKKKWKTGYVNTDLKLLVIYQIVNDFRVYVIRIFPR